MSAKSATRCELPSAIEPEVLEAAAMEAQALRSILQSGRGTANLGELLREYESTLESLMCALFPYHESTRQFWIDGVLAGDLELLRGPILRLIGKAWFVEGSSGDWLVPIQVLSAFSPESPSVEAFRVFVGNVKAGTLRDHRAHRMVHDEPEVWLLEFVVAPPMQKPALDAEAWVARVRTWASANPGRPIVAADWAPLEEKAWQQLLRARAAAGQAVEFENTWLDHGAALRIRG